jgi:hypothetical protein
MPGSISAFFYDANFPTAALSCLIAVVGSYQS